MKTSNLVVPFFLVTMAAACGDDTTVSGSGGATGSGGGTTATTTATSATGGDGGSGGADATTATTQGAGACFPDSCNAPSAGPSGTGGTGGSGTGGAGAGGSEPSCPDEAACGDEGLTCDPSVEYCEIFSSGVDGSASYSCQPLGDCAYDDCDCLESSGPPNTCTPGGDDCLALVEIAGA